MNDALNLAAKLSGIGESYVNDPRVAHNFLSYVDAIPGWSSQFAWQNEGPFACTIRSPAGKVVTAEDEDPAVAIWSAASLHLAPRPAPQAPESTGEPAAARNQ